MESLECLLCYQPPVLIGLLSCNHRLFCHICMIKLCSQNNLCLCPICKLPSDTILFTSDFQLNYHDAMKDENILKERASNGMLHIYYDELVKDIVIKANKLVCYYNGCYLSFTSMNGLKKHMNQVHKRQYCDICLQHKKCLLFQQQIYTEPEMTIHLSEGEIQESGTISIYHPFCEFCRLRFYDEELFIRHMKNHEQCHICNKYTCNKYIFYKDYFTLESHYEKSHFVCKHGNCEDSKMMQVFETEELREFHYSERHLGQQFSNKAKRKIEVMTLTAFNQVEHNQKPNDHIGVCVESQLISVSKKSELKVESHTDGPIDIREFYQDKCKYAKTLSMAEIVERLKYQIEDGEVLSMESIDFFQPLAMKSLTKREISDMFEKVYSFHISNALKRLFFETLNDGKMGFSDYCQNIQDLLCQKGLNVNFFYVFPQLIRFFRDQNPRKAYMDSFYLKRLSKLPCSVDNLLIVSKTYVRFITNFIKSIEQVIISRINNSTINLTIYMLLVKTQASKYLSLDHFYVPKQKLFNLFRMIEKVPTNKLLKINWLLKLGMPTNTHEYIVDEVYFQSPKNTVDLLQKLTNVELALLFAYFQILYQCFEFKEKYKFEKDKCDTHILKGVLTGNFKQRMPTETEIAQLIKQQALLEKSQPVTKPQTFNYKPSRVIVNRNQEPELPKHTTPAFESRNLLEGFHNPRPNIPVWDEEESSRKNKIKNKHKRLTEEEQLQKVLEESSSMYQKELMRNQEINRKQEEADSKVNKINTLLNTRKDRDEEEEFPSLANPTKQPQEAPQISIEEYNPRSKKNKTKKWQDFDPKSVKKEWDESKRTKQPPPPPPPKHNQEDQQFPTLGAESTKEQAWYQKIIPSQKVQVVDVRVKKKKGKTITLETVNIWN